MSHQTPLDSPLSAEQCDLLKILAHTFLQHDCAEKAAVLLSVVHSAEPSDIQVRKSLACAYIRCGRPHEAMLLLDLVDENGDIGPEVYLLRSQAYSQMGRVADAADAMGRFVHARMTASCRGSQ